MRRRVPSHFNWSLNTLEKNVEVVVAEFKSASPNLPAMAEKDHENTRQGSLPHGRN
jgi:hypothetical protein